MCGATAAQTNLQTAQANFYNTMVQNYNQVYGEEQSVLDAVTKSLAPIIAAGINQEGFSAAEKNSLMTSATEGVARGYQQAQQAVQAQQGAAGGSAATNVQSGETKQLSNELASADVATQAGEEQQITQADYAQGRQNYMAAVQAEEGAAGLLNATGVSGAATSAGSAEGTTAAQIASENDSVWSSVLSALGGVAGNAVGGGGILANMTSKAAPAQISGLTGSPAIAAATANLSGQSALSTQLWGTGGGAG